MTEALPELRDPLPGERLGRPLPEAPPATAAPAPAPPVAEPEHKYNSTKSPEERAEHARTAAKAKWGKKIDWLTISMEEGLALLAEIRAEGEKGATILQQRQTEQVSVANCFNFDSCHKVIDIGSGRFAGMRTRVNKDTGLPETAYACSAGCFIILCRDFVHRQG